MAPRISYVPFFLDPTFVTPGKHMEAIREGVQDYEYLVMLRDRIAVKRRSNLDSALVGRAEKLLAEAPARVLGAPGAETGLMWSDPKDRTVAEKVRIDILEMLVLLGL